jgi:beta-lactamase superfamily II metal-dependent hydrolase
LLTGDATAEVEEQLLSRGVDVGAEILKIGHHGSQYSSTEDFLKAVNPAVVVIQSGVDNDFGHPHLRTLKKLQRLGAQVLRTDQLGSITIQTDGHTWWLK